MAKYGKAEASINSGGLTLVTSDIDNTYPDPITWHAEAPVEVRSIQPKAACGK